MSEAKCQCQKCHQPIAFDEEHSGKLADCPHCGQSTTLYIPAPSKPIVRAAAPNTPAIAPETSPADAIPQSTYIAAYALAIFMPILGIILGLYIITKKDAASGMTVIVASALAAIVWLVLLTGITS